MFEHDDHRPDDPTGTDAAVGAVEVVWGLLTLPFAIVALIYRVLRWWLIVWVDDSPFAKRARARDRSKRSAM